MIALFMPHSLFQLFKIFLQAGWMAWGGPISQIEYLERLSTERFQWLKPEEFKRLLVLYQLLPGPEAHELCVHLGTQQRGALGGLTAGFGFMLPGLLFTLLMAFAYLSLLDTALVGWCIAATPMITAFLFKNVLGLCTRLLHRLSLTMTAVMMMFLALLEIPHLWILTLSGIWYVLWVKGYKTTAVGFFIISSLGAAILIGQHLTTTNPLFSSPPETLSHLYLFLSSLKAGLFSFGGAYTTIAFLKENIVHPSGPITSQVFIDAMTLVSILPTPFVMITGFLGYVASGLSGGLMMVLGMFIPAFMLPICCYYSRKKLQQLLTLQLFIEGMAAGVLGIFGMTVVTIMQRTLTTPHQSIWFAIALVGFLMIRRPWGASAIIVSLSTCAWLFSSL